MDSDKAGPTLKVLLVLLTIIAAVATVFSCAVGYMTLLKPQQLMVMVENLSGVTPSSQIVTLVVTATPAPIPTAPETSTSMPLSVTVTATPTRPTFTPSPVPPTRTPTPDPRYFWDTFEDGIRPDWNFQGDGARSVGGRLVVNSYAESDLGGNNWTNYAITLSSVTWDRNDIRIRVREQNRDNYYLFLLSNCKGCAGSYEYLECFVVTNGQEAPIPETNVGIGYNQDIRIEADGSKFRVLANGEPKLRFVDSTYATGGVNLHFVETSGNTSMEAFEIRSLPSTE